MAILYHFGCAHCGRHILVRASNAGKAKRCPTCKKPIVIPSAEMLKPADDGVGVDEGGSLFGVTSLACFGIAVAGIVLTGVLFGPGAGLGIVYYGSINVVAVTSLGLLCAGWGLVLVRRSSARGGAGWCVAGLILNGLPWLIGFSMMFSMLK